MRSDLWDIRIVAGEGKYRILRRLANRRHVLATKLAITAFRYWFGRGETPKYGRIAFVKGPNQLRHHQYTETLRNLRLGDLETFSDKSHTAAINLFPRITTGQFCVLVMLALCIFFRGRRRDVLAYLLVFYRAIQKITKTELSDLEVFVCYNDQIFDVAAIVQALNRQGRCRTIVVQHGLVLSPDFYFPVNAQEFWSWGELSRVHFRGRMPNCQFLVTGRYAEDRSIKALAPEIPELGERLVVLVAVSFNHGEIQEAVSELVQIHDELSEEQRANVHFWIKFHPATRWRWKIRAILALQVPWLEVVDGDMEKLAEQSDVLVTVNSSSLVDFLLRGKPVFRIFDRAPTSFPASKCAFRLSDFKTIIAQERTCLERENVARLEFLKSALNV
ncbi:hypothetical protein ACQ5SP_14865 [Rhodovulum sp. YNF3179]|uniref:hypothetical protein n=1 Tax=Rhodovulum sp. YNF3179 TaxID=3425127 RepID=UPI003D33DFD5